MTYGQLLDRETAGTDDTERFRRIVSVLVAGLVETGQGERAAAYYESVGRVDGGDPGLKTASAEAAVIIRATLRDQAVGGGHTC